MLLMALLSASILVLIGGLAVWLAAVRKQRIRQASRSKRTSEYAERSATWRSYLQLHTPRRVSRLTDQRESGG